MVRAAPLTSVEDPLHRRSKPTRMSCALAKAFRFALHVKKIDVPFGAEKRMVSHRQICLQGLLSVPTKITLLT